MEQVAVMEEVEEEDPEEIEGVSSMDTVARPDGPHQLWDHPHSPPRECRLSPQLD